jgi:2-polyprenyl-3-methyl-5-hydroxy-6-metoxy-1,4-benzoquinol methylase
MISADETKYWDKAYSSGEYLQNWEFDHPSPELVAITASNIIPKKGKCLDVGCGAGSETIFLAGCGYDVTGIDFSKEALEIAKKRARSKKVKVNWIYSSVLDTGLKPHTIDFINDRGCFHLIENKNRKKYAMEMYKLLKTGGYLFIRACRNINNVERFIIINEKCIDKYFSKKLFKRGPVLPTTLISNAGTRDGDVVMLRKI